MRRGILSHCLSIFLICWTIGTFYVLFEEIVPVTRTHFWSYQNFLNRADFVAYPEKLPESANHVRYYFYEGFFTDKSGYRVTYAREDYDMIKKDRWEFRARFIDIEGNYCYDGNKQYLDRQQMEDRRIDFLNQLLPEEQDDGGYYILTYSLCETQEVYSYHCILCNDEACEMIELSYHGPT